MTLNERNRIDKKVKVWQTDQPTDGRMDGQSGVYSRVHATNNTLIVLEVGRLISPALLTRQATRDFIYFVIFYSSFFLPRLAMFTFLLYFLPSISPLPLHPSSHVREFYFPQTQVQRIVVSHLTTGGGRRKGLGEGGRYWIIPPPLQ